MGNKFKLKNTITYSVELERGWGVTFYPFDNWHMNEDGELIEDDTIVDIEPILVEIGKDTVEMFGNKAYVKIKDVTSEDMEVDFEVNGFKKHKSLWEGDTHDLRSYFFKTKEEAEKHIEKTVRRFKNPEPWECFVKHDYFKYV